MSTVFRRAYSAVFREAVVLLLKTMNLLIGRHFLHVFHVYANAGRIPRTLHLRRSRMQIYWFRANGFRFRQQLYTRRHERRQVRQEQYFKINCFLEDNITQYFYLNSTG